MASNEHKVLKSNSFEDWRQKTNEISFDLGDDSLLDDARLGDRVFDYTASANQVRFSGNNLEIQILPDQTLDNTGGYIILAHGTSIPNSFVNNATVTQSGGYSATIESVVTNDSKTKILVKNSSGDFNTAQGIIVGSDTIAANKVERIISESFKVGKVRVTRDGGVVPHDLSEGGFHIAPLKADITLANTPSVDEFTEGSLVYQDSANRTTQATVEANASWYGVVLHANTSNILVKTSVGTFNANSDLRILGYDLATASVANADLSSITVKDDSVAHMIEFNNESTSGHAVKVITTTALSAINELQDDVGTVENLNTSAGDLTAAINEHESDIGNMSLTGLSATNLSAAARELRTELGDVTTINDATGYSATDASAGILEIQGDIGDVDALTPSAGTIVGALNEIEAVFDASAYEISAGSNNFAINSSDLTLNSSGDINLDADGADIVLKDNGTEFGRLTNSSGQLVIASGSNQVVLTANNTNATFNNNVTIENNLDVDNDLNVDGAGVIDGTLDVGALATLHSLSVTNNAAVGGNLGVTGTGSVGGDFDVNTNKFTVASASGNTVVAGTLGAGATTLASLGVTGAAGIDGDFDINTNKFTVASATGNTVIGGTLSVGSLTTSAQTVRLAINELQSEVGSAVFTGDITNGAGSVTSAIGLIEAEIGDDEAYANGTITFGASTISGTLVNLNNELDALNALTLTAGDGLSGGGTLADDRSFAVNVDDSSIEINSDSLRVKALGITNAMLAGGITNAKLAGSIANSKLSNSLITFAVDNDGTSSTDNVSLGQQLLFTIGEGLNGAIASNEITLSAELASETNAGVATFDGTDFTVTSGDVTLKTERIQDIVGTMVAGNTEDGIVVTYRDDDGTIDFEVDSTIVRTSGDQNIAGNKNIPSGGSLTIDSGATLTVNGTLTIAGSTNDISTFGVDFLETDGGGTSQGLQIKNQTVHSGYSVAPQLFWNHSQVSVDPRKAWQVKGLAADGTTAETSSLVTFENARSLIASNDESGINVTFDNTNNNFDFNVNDPTISFSGGDVSGSYTMTNLGDVSNVALTIGAGVVENSMLAGSIANSKLTNSSITISDGSNTSPVSLGGTLTIQGTSSEVTVAENAGTVTVGLPDDVTIANDLTVTGDLIVSGDTTTLNTATLDVEDLNITVGSGASSLAATNGAGITFGASTSKPTLTWDNGNTRLTVNKRLHSSVGFTGNVTGNASGTAGSLANAQNFSITGDITASNVSFNGTSGVTLDASIDANVVGASELKVGSNGTSGQVLASDGDGTFSWVTRDNYSSWTASDGAGTPTSYTITSGDTLSFVDTSHIEPRFTADDQLLFNIVSNSIGAAQLNVSGNGTSGQALLSDGDGTMTWGNISSDNFYVTSAAFNTGNGVLTLSRNGGLSNVTVNLDGRYSTTDTNTVTRVREDSGTYRSGDLTLVSGTNVTISETSAGVFNFAATDTNTEYSVGDGGLTQKNFTTTLKNKLDGIAASANNYSLPQATSSALGGVKIGYSENGKNYPVELSNGQMYVNVPWTDTNTNTQRGAGSGLVLDGNNLKANLISYTAQTVAANSASSTTNRTYPIQVDSDGDLVVNVPWSDTNTDTNTFRTVEVDTNGNGSANNTLGATETLRFKKGSNISLSEAGGIITISSTDTDTVYTHPEFTARSVSINTSGAEVLDTLTLTSNNIGSVTAASATKRTLTLANLGYTGATNAQVNQDAFAKIQSQNNGTNSTLHDSDAARDTFTINAGSGISITDGTDKITLDATIGDAFSNVRIQQSNGDLIANNTASGSATLSLREGTDIDLTQPSAGVIQIAYSGNATANSAGTGIDINGSGQISLSNDHRKGDNIDVFVGSGNTYAQFDNTGGPGGIDRITLYLDDSADFDFYEGGNFHANGDVIAFSTSVTSDVKLKDNIQKIDGALELVDQLDGVTFTWKKDGKASAGVIAQNVEKVLPSAVNEVETRDGEEINKHVDYNQLSALFIEAIKELKEENKLLRAEIEGLKDINNR